MAKFQAKKICWLTFFLSVFAICLSVKGFSLQSVFRERGELSSVIGTVVGHKFYVDPGSVYVAPEGIYITHLTQKGQNEEARDFEKSINSKSAVIFY